MNDDLVVVENFTPGIFGKILRMGACLLAALILIVALAELRKAGVPNAPVAWVYVAVAVAILTLVIQIPAVFYRLPKVGRKAATAMLIIAVVIIALEVGQMDEYWSVSPEGKKEEADAAKRELEREAQEAVDAKDAAEKEAAARTIAQLKETEQKLKELSEKLEGCFTTFGHRLPALEDPVRDSMHNPSAFEFVKSVVTVPDGAGNNVEMTFRAENAFGAIRTAKVRAQLVPDDCSIQNIGEPTID